MSSCPVFQRGHSIPFPELRPVEPFFQKVFFRGRFRVKSALNGSPGKEGDSYKDQIFYLPLITYGAKLLIAADCTAYAYANIHEDFMKGKVTLIGCPKLDVVDYSGKLTEIIRNNDIRSVTILRMEVPCCGGLEATVRKALRESGKAIPQRTVTISIDGKILDDQGRE